MGNNMTTTRQNTEDINIVNIKKLNDIVQVPPSDLTIPMVLDAGKRAYEVQQSHLQRVVDAQATQIQLNEAILQRLESIDQHLLERNVMIASLQQNLRREGERRVKLEARTNSQLEAFGKIIEKMNSSTNVSKGQTRKQQGKQRNNMGRNKKDKEKKILPGRMRLPVEEQPKNKDFIWDRTANSSAAKASVAMASTSKGKGTEPRNTIKKAKANSPAQCRVKCEHCKTLVVAGNGNESLIHHIQYHCKSAPEEQRKITVRQAECPFCHKTLGALYLPKHIENRCRVKRLQNQ